MSKKISPVRLLSGTFCGDLFCNFRRLLVLVAMHITAPDIFMASYFMEITFFFKCFRDSLILFYCGIFWWSQKLEVFLSGGQKNPSFSKTYQHMYVLYRASQLFLIETNPMFIHA